jgi:hypothetical protein
MPKIGMMFTTTSTVTKPAPSGYNPVTMSMPSVPSTSKKGPATMTFSGLSSYKKTRGCGSCGGR